MNLILLFVTLISLLSLSCATLFNQEDPKCNQYLLDADAEILEWESKWENSTFPSYLEKSGGMKSVDDNLFYAKNCAGHDLLEKRYAALKIKWKEAKERNEKNSKTAILKDEEEQESFRKRFPGVLRTSDMMWNDWTKTQESAYWKLSQISGEWALFSYRRPKGYSYLIAIKKMSLTNFLPNATLVSVAECIRHIGSETWDNLAGFPIEVRKYDAFRCHELEK